MTRASSHLDIIVCDWSCPSVLIEDAVDIDGLQQVWVQPRMSWFWAWSVTCTKSFSWELVSWSSGLVGSSKVLDALIVVLEDS